MDENSSDHNFGDGVAGQPHPNDGPPAPATPAKVEHPAPANALSATPERLDTHPSPPLLINHPPRRRDRLHLKFVAAQPCLLCGRTPSDAHHLRFAQQRALGRKVSDEFTVPLCRTHHRQLHNSGNEIAWWIDMDIDPLPIAQSLWQDSLHRTEASTRSIKPGKPDTPVMLQKKA